MLLILKILAFSNYLMLNNITCVFHEDIRPEAIACNDLPHESYRDTFQLVFMMSFNDTITVHIGEELIFNDLVNSDTYGIENNNNTSLKVDFTPGVDKCIVVQYQDIVEQCDLSLMEDKKYMYAYAFRLKKEDAQQLKLYPFDKYYESR